MRINSISFHPYIYNTNFLSRSSMNKVSAIPDDLLSSKTDFSGLTDGDLNENPLRRGETSHFADVLQMQFQTGQQNAARLIRPAADNEELLPNKETPLNPNIMQKAIDAYQANMIA